MDPCTYPSAENANTVIHSHGYFRVASLPDLHVFFLQWKETGAPGENLPGASE